MKPIKPEEETSWRDLELGCAVLHPGSASQYKSGDWRSDRPVWDSSKCIKCGICYIFCPEACVKEDEEGFFGADLYYCKGCGICAKECWTGAISMVEEGV